MKFNGLLAAGGGGAALLVAAGLSTIAWGKDAWAAYQVAAANYSLGAAAGSGAIGSGTVYTLGATAGATYDKWINGADFSAAFEQRFAPKRCQGHFGKRCQEKGARKKVPRKKVPGKKVPGTISGEKGARDNF